MKTSLSYKVVQFARKYGHNFHEEEQPGVIAMRNEIAQLGADGITFQVSQHPDGSWTAMSINVDGIITGGFNMKEAETTIKDATLTYYGISPKHANDNLLRSIGKPITTEHEVLVTA